MSVKDYPVKPVRVVVPTQAGGGYDYIARVLAEKLPAVLLKQLAQFVRNAGIKGE